MQIPIRYIYFVIFYVGLFFFLPNTVLAADHKLDSLNRVLSMTKNDSKKAEIYNLLAAHTISSDYHQSLSYAQQSVKFATKSQDHSLLMSGYKNIAFVFFYTGIYDQALHYFELCADEALIIKNEFERLNCQLNQALIYSALGEYKKAIPILIRGKQLLENTYQSAGKPIPTADFISIKLNLAYNYIAVNDYQKACLLLDSGIVTARLHTDQVPLLVKLLQLKAKSLLDENKVEDAISNLREAEAILKTLNDRSAIVMLKGLWAKAYNKMNDYENAIRVYRESYNEAIVMGSLSMKTEYANELYKIFNARKQADSAIKYFNLFTAYEKEANNSKTKEDLIRKELLQEFQNREIILAKEYASKKNNFLSLIAAFAFFLVVSGVGLFLFRKKYLNANLHKIKMELDAQRNELEKKGLQAQVSYQEKQMIDYQNKISKNKILESLVDDLEQFIAGETKENYPSSLLSSSLNQARQGKVWEEFEIRFLKTNVGFYDRLLSIHSNLTPNERRLCAFLRLDLTTKEISVITGQSVRAVEIARTRLRKKLNLAQADKGLFDYLASV